MNARIEFNNAVIDPSGVLKCNVQLQSDQTGQTMPISNCTVKIKLDNVTEQINYSYNQPFTVEINDIKKKFYCRKATKDRDFITIEGVDMIGVLADQDFNKRMYFTTRQCTDVLREIMGTSLTLGVDYTVDDTVLALANQGYIGHCSRREALRHWCIATGVYPATNDEGNLYFRTVANEAVPTYYEVIYSDDEVFEDMQRPSSPRYSTISTDQFHFQTNSSYSDDYVEYNGTKYYWKKEKVSKSISTYPADLPHKELYIQDEMLIATTGADSGTYQAQGLNNRLDKYYGVDYDLTAVVVSDRTAYKTNMGIGSMALFGKPTKITLDAGTNAIKYEVNGLYKKNANILVKLILHYAPNTLMEYAKSDVFYAIRGSRITLPRIIKVDIDNYNSRLVLAPDVTQTNAVEMAGDLRVEQQEDYLLIERVISCDTISNQNGSDITIYRADNVTQSGKILEVNK